MKIKETILHLYKQGKTRTEIFEEVRPLSEAKDEHLKDKITKVIRAYKSTLSDPDIYDDQATEKGQFVKGRSTLVNKRTGEKVIEWIKTDVNKEQLFIQTKQALESILGDIKDNTPPLKYIPYNINTTEDTLSFYPLPDIHFGLLANEEETGNDSNTEIIAKRIHQSFDYLMQNTPDTQTALVVDLGDFIHSSDDNNRTKSGHPLDVDTRHWRVIKIAFTVMRDVINKLLTKHNKVIFKGVGGNHSVNASYYLLLYLDACFANDPRVEVEVSPKLFQYYKHGRCLHAFNHGNEIKDKDLVETVLHDCRDMVSHVDFIYIHVGHWHTSKVVSTKLAKVIYHGNLNTLDAWAYSKGFRNMFTFESECIIYSDTRGEISTINFNNFSM